MCPWIPLCPNDVVSHGCQVSAQCFKSLVRGPPNLIMSLTSHYAQEIHTHPTKLGLYGENKPKIRHFGRVILMLLKFSSSTKSKDWSSRKTGREHPGIEAAPSQVRPGQGTSAQGITREVAPKQPSTNTAFLQHRKIQLSNSFVCVPLTKLEKHKLPHAHMRGEDTSALAIPSMMSFPHIKHARTQGAEDIWCYITPAIRNHEKPFNETERQIKQSEAIDYPEMPAAGLLPTDGEWVGKHSAVLCLKEMFQRRGLQGCRDSAKVLITVSTFFSLVRRTAQCGPQVSC